MIGICSLLLAVSLAIGKLVQACNNLGTDHDNSAMRLILIRENRILDEDEQGGLKMAKQERIEQAARLEGITLEEAMDKKRGFRYLY